MIHYITSLKAKDHLGYSQELRFFLWALRLVYSKLLRRKNWLCELCDVGHVEGPIFDCAVRMVLKEPPLHEMTWKNPEIFRCADEWLIDFSVAGQGNMNQYLFTFLFVLQSKCFCKWFVNFFVVNSLDWTVKDAVAVFVFLDFHCILDLARMTSWCLVSPWGLDIVIWMTIIIIHFLQSYNNTVEFSLWHT